MKTFVLFSMPRTGSTMLRTRLSQHPDVKCFGEVFGPPFKPELKKGVSGRLPQWADIEKRCSNIDAFLADIYRIGRRYRAVGFKHHLSADPRVTLHALEARDMARFHIVRPNHLATYSSNKLVHLTGQPNVRQIGAVVVAKAEFDAGEFEQHIEKRESLHDEWRPAFEAAGVVEISYLEACGDDGVAAIWRKLGMKPLTESEAKTIKKNPSSLLDRFVNPDVAAAWLAKNGREDWSVEA